MATHSSVLAWRVPGTGEAGGLPSMGLHSQTRLKRLSSSSSSYPEGFDRGPRQQQNKKNTLGALVPAVEGCRATTQSDGADGTAAMCSLWCFPPGGRLSKKPAWVLAVTACILPSSHDLLCTVPVQHFMFLSQSEKRDSACGLGDDRGLTEKWAWLLGWQQGTAIILWTSMKGWSSKAPGSKVYPPVGLLAL